MGKIRHASYNSRSSGFTTTISNLLLLFHSSINTLYQNYCKQLCTLKRLVNLNVVLEKCSRWKFAEHDEQQYDDHQGKVADIDLEFSLFPSSPRHPHCTVQTKHRSSDRATHTNERILPVCGNYSSDEQTESVKQQVLFALTAAHLNLCSPVTILVLKSLGYC